jgi:hypothetical protein
MDLHKMLSLPLVLAECEIWSLTLGDEHRLRLPEGKMLRMS